MITRRAAVAGLATLLAPIAARGASPEELKVTSGGDSLSVCAMLRPDRRSALP